MAGTHVGKVNHSGVVGTHAESSSTVGSGCVDLTGDSTVSVSWASTFVGSDVVGMSGNIRCSILVGCATSSLIGWLHVQFRI